MIYFNRLPAPAAWKKYALRTVAWLVTLLCLASMATLTGCTSAKDKQNQQIVATCNGFDIKYEELRFLTLFYKDTLANTYGKNIWDDPDTAEAYRAELEEMVKKHLNENYIILTACQAWNVDINDKAADDYAKNQIKTLIRDEFDGSTRAYRSWLKEHYMSEDYFRFSIRVSYLDSVLFNTLDRGGFLAYDYTNIDEFIEYVLTSPDYARTVHVYLRNDEGESPEENRAEAEQISRALRAVANEKQRLEIMNEYIGSVINDDLTSISDNGYYFTKGEMNEAYENAAFALEIGEVSEAFACSGGYFVVMRLAPEEEYVMLNFQTLLQNYQAAALGFIEESFRDECTVEYTEYGQSLDLLAIE